MTAPDELLTTADVAALYTLPASTLRTWRQLGRGPAWFQLGRVVRYRRSVVLAWLDAQEHKQQAAS